METLVCCVMPSLHLWKKVNICFLFIGALYKVDSTG